VISDAELVDTSVNQRDLWDDSAYYNFYRAGVPFLYFEATNWRIGYQDGFTQVGPIGTTWYGKKGAIYHTRFDTVAYIDTIPAYSNKSGLGQRIGDRMAVFGDLLDRIVRDYEA